MKTLQLALRLRMIRPGVPPGYRGASATAPAPSKAGGVSPRGAVVHCHPVRQAVAFKHADQPLLHGLTPFISTVRRTGKTGVVVQQGERMAAATAKGKVALKIHLPEPVRRVMFRTAPWRECPVKCPAAGRDGPSGYERC